MATDHIQPVTSANGAEAVHRRPSEADAAAERARSGGSQGGPAVGSSDPAGVSPSFESGRGLRGRVVNLTI